MKKNIILGLLVFSYIISSQSCFASGEPKKPAFEACSRGKKYDPWKLTMPSGIGGTGVELGEMHCLGLISIGVGFGAVALAKGCGIPYVSCLNIPACGIATFGCVTVCRSHLTALAAQALQESVPANSTGNAKLE